MSKKLDTALFEHELTGTSAVFGRNHGISVVVQGDQACTDGNTIFYPSLNHDARLTEEEKRVSRGYVDHEAGHLRHTEMAVMKEAHALAQREGRKNVPALLNALEDMRLEKIVMGEYPGAKKNLGATAKCVNERYLEDLAEGKLSEQVKDDRAMAAIACTWRGRQMMGHPDEGTSAKCLDTVSGPLQRATQKWLEALEFCESTRDVLDLAKVIDTHVTDGSYSAPDYEPGFKPGGGDGEGAEGGQEAGTSEGRGSGSNQEAGPASGGGDASAKDDDKGEVKSNTGVAEGETEAQQSHGGTGAGGDEVSSMKAKDVTQADFDPVLYQPSDAVKKMVERHATNRKDHYRPFSTAYDKWHTRHDADDKYGGSGLAKVLKAYTAHQYDELLKGMSGKISTMRRKLQRALMAQQRRDWDHGRMHGRLDSKRLVAAVRGHENVYKMRQDGKDLDTAVSVLIDLSGSMCGQEIYLARSVAVALCEVFETVGVSYEVLGFRNSSGYSHRSDGTRSTKDERLEVRGQLGHKNWSRTEPLDMVVFKAFDERLRPAKGAMASIVDCAGGNNSDGEALLYQYERLRVRTEKRKVMLTLSDGYPASGCDFPGDHLGQHLRDVVEMVRTSGVQLVGIGIESDAVRQFYPRWTVCNDLEDLPKATMDQVARLLVDEKFKVDNSDLMKASAGAGRRR